MLQYATVYAIVYAIVYATVYATVYAVLCYSIYAIVLCATVCYSML